LDFFILQTKHPELDARLAYLPAPLRVHFIFDDRETHEHVSQFREVLSFLFRALFPQTKVITNIFAMLSHPSIRNHAPVTFFPTVCRIPPFLRENFR
jgi:hypothetical protein